MSGEPLPLVLPPGLNRDVSRYTAKQQWWDGNLVRWNNRGVMTPIGGWIDTHLTGYTNTQPFRKMFSWRDNNYNPWMVIGSVDKVYAIKIGATPVTYDITPVGLVWQPSITGGFGAGFFGAGQFGFDSPPTGSSTKFDDGIWSFDNWGGDLVAVHSADGRLWTWSPGTPTLKLVLVAGAPIGNRIVLVTNERFCVVMGGYGNPRKVKWCDKENLTDWVPSDINAAGGFELETRGVIFGACNTPGGILIFTDIDIYLMEYEDAPAYYGRRLMSDETGIVGPNAFAPTPNGAVLLGQHSFWTFNNGLVKLDCSLSSEIFGKMNLQRPNNIFMGVNAVNQEVWTFYPGAEQINAGTVLIFNKEGLPWWSKALLNRTAWLSPIWQTEPYAVSNNVIYQHETGWTDNGAPRDVWAETGVLEFNNGAQNIRIDRIYSDTMTDEDDFVGTPPYTLAFEMKQSPQGPPRSVGPITLSDKGYTTVRFRGRQITMRVQETTQENWGLGTLRIRAKPGGAR